MLAWPVLCDADAHLRQKLPAPGQFHKSAPFSIAGSCPLRLVRVREFLPGRGLNAWVSVEPTKWVNEGNEVSAESMRIWFRLMGHLNLSMNWRPRALAPCSQLG